MNKNKLLAISCAAFFSGMVIAGWGWDKETSTIKKRTKGAVTMIVVGCVMIVGGGIGMAVLGSGRTKG